MKFFVGVKPVLSASYDFNVSGYNIIIKLTV